MRLMKEEQTRYKIRNMGCNKHGWQVGYKFYLPHCRYSLLAAILLEAATRILAVMVGASTDEKEQLQQSHSSS